MQYELAKVLVEAAAENGIEASIYNNYSGRGMYGKTTTGISLDDCDSTVIVGLMYASAHRISELMEEGVLSEELESSIRTDSLGRGLIVY